MLSSCKSIVDGIDVSDYKAVQRTTNQYFNTFITVACYLPEDQLQKFYDLWEYEINNVAQSVYKTLDSSLQNSDIYKFNNAPAGEVLEISELTYNVLSLAKQAYEMTDGAYNPALALSVDLWGFSSRFNEGNYVATKPYDRQDYRTNLPDKEYVEAFASLSDFSKTELIQKEQKYYVKKAQTTAVVDGVEYTQQLDLGGIGKGYCADLIADILTQNGIEFGYVNIGSSSMRLLKNAKKSNSPVLGDWSVALISPTQKSAHYYEAYLKDVSLSTSGNYQLYYDLDGIRYSHIIDGNTGAPYNSEILTASVFGQDGALCDALSTAVCVMGKEKALEFLAGLEGCTYVFATGGGENIQVFSNCNGSSLV